MDDMAVRAVIRLLGYPDVVPEDLIRTIKAKAMAVDEYLTEIGVTDEKKQGDLYLQTIALGVNDLMSFSEKGFSGLFERLSMTLR